MTEPHVIDRVRVAPDDNGPKREFWGPVWLLLMSDGTVRWESSND